MPSGRTIVTAAAVGLIAGALFALWSTVAAATGTAPLPAGDTAAPALVAPATGSH